MLRRNSTTIRAGGKVVGVVEGDTFRKSVRGSVHMLQKPPAWALDSRSLNEAARLGASTVEIHDVETDITYMAKIDRVLLKGFDFDRGHGQQVGLALKHWSKCRPGEAQQLPLAMGAPSYE